MALDTYRRKRDFRRTPEPQGGRATRRASHQFVIQKHAARRLHYDFRLELDGTLKSWAVPKGPSLDPQEKRLAVHVEDHPIEYGKFEGVIPKPEYGAGAVIVWDRGSWEPEGDPSEGYRQGKLHFTLKGEKLRGAWRLVRTSGRNDDGKEQWLLVKSKDQYVSDIDIVEALPHSVQTGRSIDDVAAQKPQRQTTLPKTLRPQLATLVDAIPESDDWLHEIKYDGYRILCHLEHGHARLYSRNGNDYTRRMAAIAHAIEQLPGFGEAWLDGEVVALGADGRTNFSSLQEALSPGRDRDLVYYAFDLPYVDGTDLTATPLRERKERLAALLRLAKHAPRIRYSDHVQGNARMFYRQACEFGLEGVISKRLDAPYRFARTHDWVKTKCRLRQEFVVGGYSDPGGTRRGIGALLLGVYNDAGEFVYCGRTGTGFSSALLESIQKRLSKHEVREPPFVSIPREARKGAHWVKPETVVEVEFATWTNDGMVRQASFQGIREDKSPTSVVREIPQHTPLDESPPGSATPSAGDPEAKKSPPSPTKKSAKTQGRAAKADAIRLTNPDKVLYPESGITKGDIAAYYASIADWIVPAVADRPLTLVRCPEGRAKECFFQKHATSTVPKELRRIEIANSDGNGTELYLAADNIDAVLSLVQMGVLEIHVWGARADKPEIPDQLVFDFDPDVAVSWDAVVEAAAHAHARLDDLGLASFLRSTGGKGLHVVVPIARRLAWPEIKAFAKAFAEDMVRLNPTRYTARLPFAARKGKIFVDYLRNGRGATAIASYSTRARTGATVAVPLAWKELSVSLKPAEFTVRSVPTRLRSLKRDPWEDFDDARRAITRAMKRELGVRD